MPAEFAHTPPALTNELTTFAVYPVPSPGPHESHPSDIEITVTPLDCIHATAFAMSTSVETTARYSSADGAMSWITSAHAVPCPPSPTGVPPNDWNCTCDASGSSLPRSASHPANSPSMTPTLTPCPVKPAACHEGAFIAATPSVVKAPASERAVTAAVRRTGRGT